MGSSSDNEDSDGSSAIELSRRYRKRSSKSSKRRSDRKKRKSQQHDNSSDDDSHYEDRKRRKKERKKKHKKEKRKRRESSEEEKVVDSLLDRNIVLADALLSLLEEHPAFVEDLPIMLIRLSSGVSFDLTQMTDMSASRGIDSVFSCLEPFGVHRDANNGSWMWKKPDSVGASSKTSELVLIRLIRAMLDQVGLTIAAIEDFECPSAHLRDVEQPCRTNDVSSGTMIANRNIIIKKDVKVLLNQFQQGELAKELAGLCNMILEGESVALDGLPDERLGSALESLLTECGLEKSEMEDADSENDDGKGNSSPTFGYGLPQEGGDDVRSHLLAVLETCQSVALAGEGPSKRAVKGPMLKPASYVEPADYAESESDEEGPFIAGAEERRPSQSSDVVKARAAHQSLELESVKQGREPPILVTGGDVREEWMLVPGKFDLLSAVKSGHSMKSRMFNARSKAAGDKASMPVDPAIDAEINAIRRAHEESRGPSLLEQHREKEKMAKKKSNEKEAWHWDRDQDLDSGRKVDKNALNMLFGKAGNDLKSKFHS